MLPILLHYATSAGDIRAKALIYVHSVNFELAVDKYHWKSAKVFCKNLIKRYYLEIIDKNRLRFPRYSARTHRSDTTMEIIDEIEKGADYEVYTEELQATNNPGVQVDNHLKETKEETVNTLREFYCKLTERRHRFILKACGSPDAKVGMKTNGKKATKNEAMKQQKKIHGTAERDKSTYYGTIDDLCNRALEEKQYFSQIM